MYNPEQFLLIIMCLLIFMSCIVMCFYFYTIKKRQVLEQIIEEEERINIPDITVNICEELQMEYGTECIICGDGMTGKETIGKIGICKHSFHRRCIMKWYTECREQNLPHNCPICRNQSPRELIISKVLTVVNNV